jgi:SAM-dependent methyltransferase
MKRLGRDLGSDYRVWREESLAQSPSTERDRLGQREIETFRILAAVTGRKPDPFTLNGQGVLIDLGCGDQYLKVPSEGAGFEYRGIDVDECNFDCDPIPAGDQTCDVVVSLAVIEHLSNPGHFLSEAWRVMRPGGTLVLSTPNWRYCVKTFWNDPTHVRPYTATSLARVAQITGFAEVSVLPGLRCKSPRHYLGKSAFWRARWLLPFRGDQRWVPEFLRGRSTSLFLIATKPDR